MLYHLLDELDLAGGAGEVLRPETRTIIMGYKSEGMHHLAVEAFRELVLWEVG